MVVHRRGDSARGHEGVGGGTLGGADDEAWKRKGVERLREGGDDVSSSRGAAAQRERQLAPTSRSVLVSTSCTSRTFGPLNISRGGRLEWASAKSLLSVQATKSAKVRHQVFTS